MPPKNGITQQTDKLAELIDKLNDRLALLCEPELKKACLHKLIAIHKHIEELQDKFTELHEIIGASYGDINYPKSD